MSRRRPPSQETFHSRLERVNRALAPPDRAPIRKDFRSLVNAPRSERSGLKVTVVGTGAVIIGLGAALGWWAILFLGTLLVGLGLFGTRIGLPAFISSSLPTELRRRDDSRPQIGPGATVASDAVIAPGASVEMGATVESGAVIQHGAIIRMGATVHRHVVVEADAVVSWGATISSGARVGARSVIGAGATVMRQTHVPPKTQLFPGTTWTQSHSADERTEPEPLPEQTSEVDPRMARVDTACVRIEVELDKASTEVREHLDLSHETVQTFRRTCRELVERERRLRQESSTESNSRLESERASLEKRLADETDEVIRRSLKGALTAIEDQTRQLNLLRRSADRLDAELTRLILVIEGIGSQLIRLNHAGMAARQSGQAGLSESVKRLHDEIDAIADALEEVSDSNRTELQPLLQR